MDEKDLFSAYQVAARSERAEVKWVARFIVDYCNVALNEGLRRAIDAKTGDLNSTDAVAPDRVALMAVQSRRAAALADLEKRCAGFSAKGRPWMIQAFKSLEKEVKASDTPLGRLLLRDSLDEADALPSYTQWKRDIVAALRSNDPVAAEAAIMSMSDSLFDRRAPYSDKDPSSLPNAIAALSAAWAQVSGDAYEAKGEALFLLLCAEFGDCNQADARAKLGKSEQQWHEYDDLVARYAAALRTLDPEAVFAVVPGGTP